MPEWMKQVEQLGKLSNEKLLLVANLAVAAAALDEIGYESLPLGAVPQVLKQRIAEIIKEE